jgi:hypothetical protein
VLAVQGSSREPDIVLARGCVYGPKDRSLFARGFAQGFRI